MIRTKSGAYLSLSSFQVLSPMAQRDFDTTQYFIVVWLKSYSHYSGKNMIELSIHMNSDITEVLEWKCCNISNLNLELIFHNTGENIVTAPDKFTLVNDKERNTFQNIYPPWPQTIAPRDYASIYCNMDEATWKNFHSIIITDGNGIEQEFPIDQ